MATNWDELAEQIISLGAPLIGGALGGPLGAAAGKILAGAIGATEATPDAVKAVIAGTGADAGECATALRKADAEFALALADVGKNQVAEVGQTQRAELNSGDILQRWWRPVYALELSLLECPAFALTLLHALWVGFEPAIAGFGNLSGLLMAYFGARFGVLGIYVSGRNREKLALATGDAVPGAIAELTKALLKRN
jgi:hypothetical protein